MKMKKFKAEKVRDASYKPRWWEADDVLVCDKCGKEFPYTSYAVKRSFKKDAVVCPECRGQKEKEEV